MSASDLCGRRILVVEDEYLLALGIADEIEDHNGVVLGPVTTLEQGITALRDQQPDACIVNINLGPDKVYELADLLIQQSIPFIFASSEDRAAIPSRFASVPLHSKPIKMIGAAATLLRQGASQRVSRSSPSQSAPH
jgi:two-component SAPR family response regulator